jgi:hypothetical protein
VPRRSRAWAPTSPWPAMPSAARRSWSRPLIWLARPATCSPPRLLSTASASPSGCGAIARAVRHAGHRRGVRVFRVGRARRR